MSSPIPRRLLPHTATYSAYTGTTSSVKQYGTAQTLAHVCFVTSRRRYKSLLGEEKSDRFIMFYDCENSSPKGVVFAVGGKVVYGAETLYVREVVPCTGSGSGIHHYEVSLV